MDEDFTQQGQLPGKLPPGPADLILYGRVGNGDKFLASAANLNITATWDAFVMVWLSINMLVGSAWRLCFLRPIACCAGQPCKIISGACHAWQDASRYSPSEDQAAVSGIWELAQAL